MQQKKVCMLGSFSVGKTSLVRRYVDGIFSDKYLTTIGVKIDQKVVTTKHADVKLVLWDIAGEDGFFRVRSSYLRGANAYILVADGTRAQTLDKAMELKERVEAVAGQVPFFLALNKSDRRDEWEVDRKTLSSLMNAGWPVLETSAKGGLNVEQMFSCLAESLLEP